MNLDFLNKVYKTKKVVSVEIVFSSVDEIEEFRASSFSFINGRFKELIPPERITSMDALIQVFGVDSAYVLTITGAGIITKGVDNIDSDMDILPQVIPNIVQEDFYFSKNHFIGKTWVSLVRRNGVDKVFQTFDALKIRVVHCFIGPLQINPTTMTVLGIGNNQMITPEYCVSFLADGQVVYEQNMEQPPNDIRVLESRYKGQMYCSLVGALSFLIGSYDNSDFEADFVLDSKQEEKYGVIFSKLLVVGVAVLFTLAISNYILGVFLSEKYNGIIEGESEKLEVQNNLDKVNLRIKEKQNFISSIGIDRKTGFSFYMDRLAQTVPKKIQLIEMNIIPILGKVKSGQRIKTDNHVIFITGLVVSEVDFNFWIKELNTVNWIETVEVVNYKPIVKSNTHEFSIKIMI